MHALHEGFTDFATGLRQGFSADTLALFCEAPEIAQRRFAAYRRNVLGNWRAALASTYPVTAELLGPQAFNELCEQTLQQHPSSNSDLNAYGQALPDMIASSRLATTYPYLADIARLEWALQTAYAAADPSPFDFTALAALSRETQALIVLECWAGCSLIASTQPIAEIWQAHQLPPGHERDTALGEIDLKPGHYAVLALRNWQGKPEILSLSAGMHTFYLACKAGLPIPDAISAAQASDAAFCINACFQTFLQWPLFTGFHLAHKETA